MKKLFMFCCLAASVTTAQNITACKERFNTYLNFRGSLSRYMQFEGNVMYLTGANGRRELAIYDEEVPVLAKFFEQKNRAQQEALIKKKGMKRFSVALLDSLKNELAVQPPIRIMIEKPLPLKGYKIAIDPGHFATSLGEAQVEKKYLYFLPAGAADSVKIFESALTFNTAWILKAMLEAQGATVFLSRDSHNHTSFNCTFSYWMKNYKGRIMDSLLKAGQISAVKYTQLMKSRELDFFWNFFRDYDLSNRAKKINEFQPHVTAIIHYNVDEKNVPWTKHTSKNFTMAFIAGAFTADNLSRVEGKLNFLRLLISDQLNRSEKLAKTTVVNFHKNLAITIAKRTDADYLRDNCLVTPSAGVFCRNLALCRKINSPLVYGESLYQDNVNESRFLMMTDLSLYGTKTNERIHKVAISYYDSLVEFLLNN